MAEKKNAPNLIWGFKKQAEWAQHRQKMLAAQISELEERLQAEGLTPEGMSEHAELQDLYDDEFYFTRLEQDMLIQAEYFREKYSR